MTPLPLVLGHAGAGATWQSLLVVMSLGLVVVFVLAVAGRIAMSQPDDLVLPLAGVAIASSLAPLGAAVLSDWVGWAFPIGVVALVALALAAITPLELTPTSPPTYGAVALAALGAVLLYQPITVAWHPPPDLLPLADDVEVAIVEPADGAVVAAGNLTVEVAIEGGSIGDGVLVASDQLPADWEEAGVLAVALDGRIVEPALAQDCDATSPCTRVSFPVEVEPGERVLTIEFRRADGASFTPLVTDRVTFIAD